MGDGNNKKSNCCSILIDRFKKKVSNKNSSKWDNVNSLIDKYKLEPDGKLKDRYREKLIAERAEYAGTVLDLTVRFGKKEQLEFLLEKKPFKSLIDTPNNNGETPLHTAVRLKHDWAVEVLLRHNADPNARDDDGSSPLHYLRSPNSTSTWKCLITDTAKKQQEFGTFLDINAFKKYTSGETHRNVCALDEEIVGEESGQNGSSKSSSKEHAKKMEQRANIYNLLMQEDYTNLLQELQTDQDVDFYVCNTKLICYVLGSMKNTTENVPALKKIVEKLLELKVDPLSSDNNGFESAVELALAKKQYGLVKQMITNLPPSEKKSISFHLLQRTFMMSADVNDPQEKEKETMKLLKFLFQISAIEDINQKNPRPGFNDTALGIAVKYHYERVLVFLLKRGAVLSDDNKEDVLENLTSESLTEVMNHAISFEPDKVDGKATAAAILNYRLLIAHQETGERKESNEADESDGTDDAGQGNETDCGNRRMKIDESGGSNETDIVMRICNKKQYKDVISHPLVWTLVMAKWSTLEKANKVYSAMTVLYSLALVIGFTAVVWSISNHETDLTKSTDQQHGMKRTVFTMCVIGLVFDVLKLVLTLWPRSLWPLRSTKIVLYLACYDILIKLFIIVSCARIIPLNFVAWIVPGAWLNFAITMGENIASFNTITTILGKITWHIGKLCVITLFLVIGFSVSFSVLIRAHQGSNNVTTQVDFSSPWLAFPRVIVMATGEFGYGELRDGLMEEERVWASVSAMLLFLVFVFLVFLVIMNVMTGVAIVEAQEIKASAAENCLKRKLEMVYIVEQLHSHKLLKYSKWWLKTQLLRCCKGLPETQLLEWLQKTLQLIYCKLLPRNQLFTFEPVLRVDMKTGKIGYSNEMVYSSEPETDSSKAESNPSEAETVPSETETEHLTAESNPLEAETDPSETETDSLTAESNHLIAKTDSSKAESDPSKAVSWITLDAKTAKKLRQKLARFREKTEKQNEKEVRHQKLEEIYNDTKLNVHANKRTRTF